MKKALKVAVQLLASFGFTEKTLRADSALLPIAYYVSHRKLGSKYLTKSSSDNDRQSIRKWLLRSLLKASGIWGSGLDTLLAALRDVIVEHGDEEFPVRKLEEVMAKRGKSLQFGEEEINELAEMPYGDKRLFALLSLMYPFVDVTNHQFHIDHIFPRSRFTKPKLKKAEIPEGEWDEYKELVDNLPNLQLLEGGANIAKQAKMPKQWMDETMNESQQAHYCEIHLLGDISGSLSDFPRFYEGRLDSTKRRIGDLLEVSSDKAD